MSRTLLLLLLLALTAPAAAVGQENTRLLLLVDCSRSMGDRWQSGPKLKISQQTLLPFLDSLASRPGFDVALRIFGSDASTPDASRLEVPFGGGGTEKVKGKLKTLVPQGQGSATDALAAVGDDFPRLEGTRNLILVVTNNIREGSDALCSAINQLQRSGLVAHTFVLGLGIASPSPAACPASLLPVPREEDLSRTLLSIFRLCSRPARLLLHLRDARGSLYPASVPLAFRDRHSGALLHSSHYSVDHRLSTDTLTLDPLAAYDLLLFTRPPMLRQLPRLAIDSLNTLDITAPQGSLKVIRTGPRPSWQLPPCAITVRQPGGERVAAQEVGETGQYLAGRYDVEVQTLPVTVLRNVEVRGNAATELSVPMPGMLVLSKPKGITTGAIFKLNDGNVEFTTDLNPSTAGERLLLQPGQYELVLHPQTATKYDKVQTKRFVIESSQTTKIQF